MSINKASKIRAWVYKLIFREEHMIQEMQMLIDQVAATKTAMDGAIADIKAQTAKIADLTNQIQAAASAVPAVDPAQLVDLTNQLKAETDALSAVLPQSG